MPKLDDQISTLQEKLGLLKLRQQRLAARQRAIAGVRDRKIDMRRKVLLGAVVMAQIKHSESDQKLIMAWLDRSLTRAADRELFGLTPLPAQEP
jgi:tellurite resistance protein